MTKRKGKGKTREPNHGAGATATPRATHRTESDMDVSRSGHATLASDASFVATSSEAIEASAERIVVPLVEETLEVNKY